MNSQEGTAKANNCTCKGSPPRSNCRPPYGLSSGSSRSKGLVLWTVAKNHQEMTPQSTALLS
eukprot:4491421-Amphidinium_carterae.1